MTNLCEEWVIWSVALESITHEKEKGVFKTLNAREKGYTPKSASEQVSAPIGFYRVPNNVFSFPFSSRLNTPSL